MQTNRFSKAAVVVAFAALLAGCGSAASSSGDNDASSGSQSSNSAQTTTNSNSASGSSTATAAGNAQNGQQLFQQNCAACHSTGTDTLVGPGLKGLFSKSSLPNGQAVNAANVENWISTGGDSMPSFSQLTAQQRADITAYLQTLS